MCEYSYIRLRPHLCPRVRLVVGFTLSLARRSGDLEVSNSGLTVERSKASSGVF